MAIVQRNVQIDASPQETMALLSDASRWPDWYPGMVGIDITAPFPEAGGKVVFKVKSAGVSMTITETVLDYQPGKVQLLQMEGMLSGQACWELTPEGDGSRLTTTFDYAPPGGVVGKLADALMIKRMNGKSLEDALHNFQSARRTPVGGSVVGAHRTRRCDADSSQMLPLPLLLPVARTEALCARSVAEAIVSSTTSA